jgi:hypothetical protein
MRIYPVRISRNRWKIQIHAIHDCDTRCETVIVPRDDFLDIRINPYYINNRCNYYRKIEKSCVSLFRYDKNDPVCDTGPMVNPNEIVIPDTSFTINIDFPLSFVLSIEIHASSYFTRNEIIYLIKMLYKFIYEEEERTATPQFYKLHKVCSSCHLNNIDDHVESIKHTDDCSICYSSLEEESVKLRCSHMFHKTCITEWIKSSATCPICRSSVFVCANCNGTRIIFYYYLGVVVPIEQRGERINRNSSNGIFGIHSYDFESLVLSEMMYDRVQKNLTFKITV